MTNSKYGIEDRRLLSLFRSGDEDAFRTLFTRWRGPLVWFVYNIIGSWDDAEDICQDTFATLWQKRGTIDIDKKINTFIFLIAKQLTWKHIRKNRLVGDVHTDAMPDHNLDLSPEEIIQSQEVEMLVRYAIDRLPPRTREIFDIYFTEGLSYEEIAHRLDINTDNVKAKIHLARTKIRDMITATIVLFYM